MATLKMPKAEPVSESMASFKTPTPDSKGDSVQQLKIPKLEPPGEKNFSPNCVLRPTLINLSSSSSSKDESDNDSESEYGAGASSDHSDRSDSDEEEYKIDSDDDEEEEEGRPPRAKKPKITSEKTTVNSEEELPGTPVKRKSRVKVTPKRTDSCPPKLRNSNPGRRRVGGRIYDSVLGETCHWCRQKTVELHVECTYCTIRFCGACLHNRNGENVELEMLVRWVCPKCRGGCGPGCKNCCNCGPCRKAQNLGPTGQLVNMARKAGFSNVHDYLVHLKTQESPEDIALRKKGREWTRDSGAHFHSSLLKRHRAKVEQEHEEEEDLKNEVVEEAELYRRRRNAKVKDEPVYVYDERRKEQIADEPRVGKISDESHVEKIYNEPRKEKISDDPRMESSDRITRNTFDSSVSRSKPTNSPVHTSISDNPSEDIWPEKSSCDTVSHRGASSCTQESDFAGELEATLGRPFSMHQMKEMWGHVKFRKPVMKLRQTRSRAIDVPCSVDGLSYLDHYPDLATKLQESTSPEEKLRLLRGFFFWLQRSCMEGAYRPWRDAPTVDDSGDCTEISGPDCEIIRVLLAIDEDEDNAPPEWEDKKPTIPPAVAKKFLPPKPAVSRFPVKVKQEKED